MLAAILALLASAPAFARTETIQWTHSRAAEVDRFRIYASQSSGVVGNLVYEGVPAPSAGVYSQSVDFADDTSFFVVVTAISVEGEESAPSNERALTVSSGGSEPPPPPPPGSGDPNAAIQGFVLWDAATDSIIDSTFMSGDEIDAAVYPCTAIEIVGNAYLSQPGSPGSVMIDVDGQGLGCSDPGITHENEPPFVIGLEEGSGQFGCSELLAEDRAGAHTIWVTPFDGNDCSGAVGDPVRLDFTVVSAPAAPDPDPEPEPEPEPLTAPGQPYLIVP